jgi:hypothetical protein
MLWDAEYLYVAADLEEPHVWATLKEHDSVIFQDNDFEVFIDPDGDNHEYYELEINALNSEWDLRLVKPYRDGGPALNSWEVPGLKSGVQVRGTLNDPRDIDQGWSVEMALPWKALAEFAHRSVPPRDGDQWRINFSRVEWKHVVVDGRYKKVPDPKEDNWVWSPQGVIDMHRPEMWGYVQFSTAEPGRTAFRPDPTWSARQYLHAIYAAQKSYHQKHGRWAGSVNDLQLGRAVPAGLTEPAQLRVLSDGYTACVRVNDPSGARSLTIRQDSRIRED